MRKAHLVIDEAHAHVAGILARSLEAVEIAEQECQAEIARIKAEADKLVVFWQGQALAGADKLKSGSGRL